LQKRGHTTLHLRSGMASFLFWGLFPFLFRVQSGIVECENENIRLPIIRVLGDPILSKTAKEIPISDILQNPEIKEAVTAGHLALSDFRQKHGYGRAIAAPQFGFSLQLICMNLGTPITIFNPQITWRSKETFRMWDDCLSFPELMACVERHVSISITFQDENGLTQSWNNLPRDLSELLQHEIDHLHGVLAVDISVKPKNCDDSGDGDKCQAVVPRSSWLEEREKFEMALEN
jgi:peptide deformylase